MNKGPAGYSPLYKHYLLILLALVCAFNYVDRLALGIMLESIKHDLSLSDTQLGLLGGIAFAFFYSIMGVPIARWADRGDRVKIIGTSTVLFSAAVALCGAAASFLQLLLIRIGAAVGEAGCQPPALSLIGDYFKRAERARATAIYGLGGPIGCLLGFFLAGYLNELFGWRMTFVLLGVPGLFLAALVMISLREPRITDLSTKPPETGSSLKEQASMSEVVKVLLKCPTFMRLLAAETTLFFFTYGLLQWLPTFFIRSHHLSSGQVGLWFALTFGVGGIAGLALGGGYSSRFAAHNETRQLQFSSAAVIVAGLSSFTIYLSPSYYPAMGLLATHVIALNATNGPILGTIQTLVPERMRAVAFALLFLFSNLIGMGLGPLAVGALSDAFQPRFGSDSLRYALLFLTPGYLLAGWQVWLASRTVIADLGSLPHDSPGELVKA